MRVSEKQRFGMTCLLGGLARLGVCRVMSGGPSFRFWKNSETFSSSKPEKNIAECLFS